MVVHWPCHDQTTTAPRDLKSVHVHPSKQEVSEHEIQNARPASVEIVLLQEFETRFFSSKQPWADLQQGHGAQFGIKQLMATMSKELVRLTKEAVPEMQLKVGSV